MRDHLVLYINGQRHAVTGRDAFLSLSDYLRRRRGLIGTKIVCSEGDCGACTVLVGRAHNPPPSKGGARGGISDLPTSNGEASQENTAHCPPPTAHSLRYLAIDSCIQFLFQLDGAHIVTVEGLAPSGRLNPVQQAMIDCHGSQCGFCTPGFVMSMTGLLEASGELEEETLRTGLTGNLCRCTGYTQIIEAGLKCNDAELERINDLYAPQPMLADFAQLRDEPVELQAEWFGELHIAYCPTTLVDALNFLAEHPTATIVAGATDVGVRMNKSGRLPPVLLDLNRIEELAHVRIENHTLIAGARATWTDLLAACGLAASEFSRILLLFGAPQIRHAGTVAGNIANASPIADSLPFLFVMEARLTLARSASAVRSATREININNFYQGYKQLDLAPGELITEVRIPLPTDADLVRLYKVSRRRDLDIATVTAALRLRLSDSNPPPSKGGARGGISDFNGPDGNVITHASIALGAVGPTVLRPRHAEQFLLGQPFTEQTMQAAADVAIEEITPITDVRGAADYRRQLVRNIFRKFYHQHQEVTNYRMTNDE